MKYIISKQTPHTCIQPLYMYAHTGGIAYKSNYKTCKLFFTEAIVWNHISQVIKSHHETCPRSHEDRLKQELTLPNKPAII